MKALSVDYDKATRAVLKAIENIKGKGVWPPRKGTHSAVFGPAFAEELFRITNELDAESLASIKHPALLWKIYLTSINGMRVAKWPKTKRMQLCNNLLSVIPLIKENDYYYENETNLLKDYVIKKEGLRLNEGESRALKSLFWMYEEALYFNFHNIGFEVHGPYEKNGKKYLVHEYGVFNPPFWNNKISSDSVVITSEFEKLDFRIDCMGNYYGELISKPDAVFINSKVNKSVFSESLSELMSQIKKLSYEDVFKKELEILWYSIKPWRDLLKEDWTPPFIEYSPEKATSFRIKNIESFMDITKDAE